MGPDANATIFAVIGLAGAFTQGFLIRRLSNRVEAIHLILGGATLAAIGFLGIAWTPTIWGLYIACIAVAFGIGITSPSISGILSKLVSPQEQGVTLGVSQSLSSLARVVGPVWAGALYDHVSIGAPYWTGALWLIASLVVISRTTSEASRPSARAASASQ